MKKTIIIGSIGTILTLLVGFWVYSFLYGNPTNTNGFFSNLGVFGQDDSVPVLPPTTDEEQPMVDVTTEQLRQLTTRPVVGARIFTTGSSTIARYVEAGTGHIYDIDMTTGSENRVSGISIPVASEAVISSSGDYIAIRSGYNNQNETSVIDLTDLANPKSGTLPNQVETFTFAFNNELLFTEFVGGQTEGKSYLPSTGVTRRLFIAPFTAHTMSWSTGSNTPHIIAAKPARDLRGYLYEVLPTGLKRLAISGDGLTVTHHGTTVLFGRTSGQSYETGSFNRATNALTTNPVVMLPDKCIYGGREGLWYCASSLSPDLRTYPDEWYKGGMQFDDRIWQIDLSGSATQLTYPLQVAGRSLDITNLAVNQSQTMLYFLNKTDKSLWVYEL